MLERLRRKLEVMGSSPIQGIVIDNFVRVW